MTRNQQRAINQKIIHRLIDYMANNSRAWRTPSYRTVIAQLNSEGLTNSRGHSWRMKTLYEMIARNGHRGLHGLKREQDLTH